MELDELYQEVILDHFKKPRCRGRVLDPDSNVTLFNPLCGDSVDVSVRIQDGKIQEVKFDGSGCSISQASASIMSELCVGKSLADALKLSSLFSAMMRGEKSVDELEALGDAVVLEGVRKFSARVKCAALAWEALEKCLKAAADHPKSK